MSQNSRQNRFEWLITGKLKPLSISRAVHSSDRSRLTRIDDTASEAQMLMMMSDYQAYFCRRDVLRGRITNWSLPFLPVNDKTHNNMRADWPVRPFRTIKDQFRPDFFTNKSKQGGCRFCFEYKSMFGAQDSMNSLQLLPFQLPYLHSKKLFLEGTT